MTRPPVVRLRPTKMWALVAPDGQVSSSGAYYDKIELPAYRFFQERCVRVLVTEIVPKRRKPRRKT